MHELHKMSLSIFTEFKKCMLCNVMLCYSFKDSSIFFLLGIWCKEPQKSWWRPFSGELQGLNVMNLMDKQRNWKRLKSVKIPCHVYKVRYNWFVVVIRHNVLWWLQIGYGDCQNCMFVLKFVDVKKLYYPQTCYRGHTNAKLGCNQI